MRQPDPLMETEDEGDNIETETNQTKGPRKPREYIQHQSTDQCEQAFRQLKRGLMNAPVLAYADSTQTYELCQCQSRQSRWVVV